MSKIYYLFSSKGNYEALLSCKDEHYINNPDFRTATYPMGILFSKMLTLLIPYIKTSFKYSDAPKNALSKFSEKTSSFSSMVYDDEHAKKIFEILLYKFFINSSRKEDRGLTSRVTNLLEYIRLCQHAWENSSVENLNNLTIRGGGKIPQYEKLIENKSDKESSSDLDTMQKPIENKFDKKSSSDLETIQESNENKSDKESGSDLKTMQELLNDADSCYKELYPPRIEMRKLFELDSSINNPRNTGLDFESPTRVYPIGNIEDFILVALNCIFEQNYVLKECQYCKTLFITHNRKQKYCPEQTPKSSEKSCYLKEKLKRQIEYEKKESVRLHKSLRTMLYNKYVTARNKELEDNNLLVYNKFLDDSKDWRDKIKKGKDTEENYVVWLKSNFSRKYKNE